jgi:uncharacterized protein (DUF1697 family)
MARYIAFLRAINVGGHNVVGMAALRELFSGLGFSHVETFIASGNVIFEARSAADRLLEKKIEKHLESALGYSVATFVRTDEEVRAISVCKPFSSVAMKEAQALNIGFLAAPLSTSSVEALMTLRTAIDDFHVHGREVYWLCRKKQSESTFSNRVFERAIKVSTTFRGANTIAKLAAKLSHVRLAPSTEI